MPSFDIVSEVNEVELRNAVDQANKEIGNRFDFKGSDARVEQTEHVLMLYADDDFKLGQVYDVLIARLAKRGVDVRALERAEPEKSQRRQDQTTGDRAHGRRIGAGQEARQAHQGQQAQGAGHDPGAGRPRIRREERYVAAGDPGWSASW